MNYESRALAMVKESTERALKGKTMGKCEQCGACCVEQGSPPCIPEDLDRMPLVVRSIIHWFSDHNPYRYDHKKECYFLSTDKKCLIYDCRPEACRDFQPGRDCPELKGKSMFTQAELEAIEDRAREMQCEGANPIWKRAWERLEDAAMGLATLMKANTLRED